MAVIGQTVRLGSQRQRQLACDLIWKAPDRAVVNIRPETRSSEQNALMWSLLSEVARAKPDGREMTAEQWKGVFMAAAGFKPVFVPDLDGEGFVCLGYKSSRLGKAEFGDLLECIMEYGARKDVPFDEGRMAA